MDVAEISAKCFWDCAEGVEGKDITIDNDHLRNYDQLFETDTINNKINLTISSRLLA